MPGGLVQRARRPTRTPFAQHVLRMRPDLVDRGPERASATFDQRIEGCGCAWQRGVVGGNETFDERTFRKTVGERFRTTRFPDTEPLAEQH